MPWFWPPYVAVDLWVFKVAYISLSAEMTNFLYDKIRQIHWLSSLSCVCVCVCVCPRACGGGERGGGGERERLTIVHWHLCRYTGYNPRHKAVRNDVRQRVRPKAGRKRQSCQVRHAVTVRVFVRESCWLALFWNRNLSVLLSSSSSSSSNNNNNIF